MCTNEALRLIPVSCDRAALRELRGWIDSDFPPAERIPFPLVRRALRRGAAKAVTLSDGLTHFGYALYQKVEPGHVMHIIYLAMFPKLRGQGYGGRFLELLRREAEDFAIVLEVEDPAAAKGEEERVLREKRICFYERNGFFVVPNVEMDMFGVSMRIMVDREVQTESWEALFRNVYRNISGVRFTPLRIRVRDTGAEQN